jgi:hypothetical protein
MHGVSSPPRAPSPQGAAADVGSVQSLGKVLGLLGGKSDEEKFAGLLLVTKTVRASTRMRLFCFSFLFLPRTFPPLWGRAMLIYPAIHAQHPRMCAMCKKSWHIHPPAPQKTVEIPGLGRMHVHPDDEETIKRYPSHPPSLHLEPRIPSPLHSTWIRSDDAYAMWPIILASHPLSPHFLNPSPPHAPSPCR